MSLVFMDMLLPHDPYCRGRSFERTIGCCWLRARCDYCRLLRPAAEDQPTDRPTDWASDIFSQDCTLRLAQGLGGGVELRPSESPTSGHQYPAPSRRRRWLRCCVQAPHAASDHIMGCNLCRHRFHGNHRRGILDCGVALCCWRPCYRVDACLPARLSVSLPVCPQSSSVCRSLVK